MSFLVVEDGRKLLDYAGGGGAAMSNQPQQKLLTNKHHGEERIRSFLRQNRQNIGLNKVIEYQFLSLKRKHQHHRNLNVRQKS